MKFIHLSDLHLGKRVDKYLMTEDQKYILKQIINIIDDKKPDGVIIAGDVYDTPMPTIEAVKMLDEFLVNLANRDLKVFIISGNHDSPERIAYGRHIMKTKGIYLSQAYDGNDIEPVQLSDDFGEINIYMLPFVNLSRINRMTDEKFENYTEGIKHIIDKMNVDTTKRNILVAHQFVTGGESFGSEDNIGGVDNVESYVFDAFDYVALGHLHSPQEVGSKKIWYCGSPLKYSFAETKNKSVSIVEFLEKGKVEHKTEDLFPKYDLVELKGTYETLTQESFYKDKTWQEDYVSIILTDENVIPGDLGSLSTIYHRILNLSYERYKTATYKSSIATDFEVTKKSPIEVLGDLYKFQEKEMSEQQIQFVKDMIKEMQEDKQ